MKNWKVTALASLGAAFEYYDFIIYGMMATYLAQVFFVSGAPGSSLVEIFMIFALAYVVRPFGGVIFGTISDRFGRQKTFATIMGVMAASTFAIGLLPTYATAGSLAVFLLLFCRILQGISFGAELPGAVTFVSEHQPQETKAFHISWIISSTSIGAMLASATLWVITSLVSEEAMLSWGWRVPFLLGGGLAVISYMIRKKMLETPEFSKDEEKDQYLTNWDPLMNVLKTQLDKVLLAIGLIILSAVLIIVNMYFPAYLSTYFDYDMSDIYLCMTIALIWVAVIIPFIGKWVDKIGALKLLMRSAIVMIFALQIFYMLLSTGSFIGLLLFLCLYQVFIALTMVSYFPYVTKIFKTSIRFTSIAISYNFAYLLASFSPSLITFMIEGNDRSYLFLFLACAALITFLSGWKLKYKSF